MTVALLELWAWNLNVPGLNLTLDDSFPGILIYFTWDLTQFKICENLSPSSKLYSKYSGLCDSWALLI